MFNTTTVPTTQSFDSMLDAEIGMYEFPDGTPRNPLACDLPPVMPTTDDLRARILAIR
jgi:hypothetical protein